MSAAGKATDLAVLIDRMQRASNFAQNGVFRIENHFVGDPLEEADTAIFAAKLMLDEALAELAKLRPSPTT